MKKCWRWRCCNKRASWVSTCVS